MGLSEYGDTENSVYDLSMEHVLNLSRTLSLPVQQLMRASERVIAFATNHKGLPQEDFEAVLLCAHELIHEIKASRTGERHPARQELQICRLCRLVRDERETAYERWITKQTYQEDTGINPADCRLSYTYCPSCYAHFISEIRAA